MNDEPFAAALGEAVGKVGALNSNLDALAVTHPLAEKIAREIEAQAEFEGVRAQRIIRMCAEVARRVQP